MPKNLKRSYALITSTDPQEFTNSVNAAMAEGWVLVGGVDTTREHGKPGEPAKIHFSQAMARLGVNGIDLTF